MSADNYTDAGPVEGIYIETAHEFWGIPAPTSEEIDTQSHYEGLLLLEPREMYDKCIVGVVRRFNDRFILYNQKCVLDALETSFREDIQTDPRREEKDEPDPHLDAIEWFEFNIIGGWVGEHTPGFLEPVADDE